MNKSCEPAWLSNASGNKCMKAVAKSAPAARLSMCCVERASTPKLKAAASHTLPIPAVSVPNRIAINIIANYAYYSTALRPKSLQK